MLLLMLWTDVVWYDSDVCAFSGLLERLRFCWYRDDDTDMYADDIADCCEGVGDGPLPRDWYCFSEISVATSALLLWLLLLLLLTIEGGDFRD